MIALSTLLIARHPSESWDPALCPVDIKSWIPAFAGMTSAKEVRE
jgi:hypothetical protein